jgi:hypothetical protein
MFLKTKLVLFSVTALMAASFAFSAMAIDFVQYEGQGVSTFLDSVPANDAKCQVKGNTGLDAAGLTCVCSDDPDGDPYFVWVCK